MSKNKRFVLSDGSSINSKGYRVDINGLDLTRFKSNPVMLYEHNSENIIGRWTDVQKEDQRLTAVPEFDTEDVSVLNIAGKVERGFLNGASIGIIVREIKEVNGVDTVTKSELFEASIVSVPADANAVRLYNDNLECLTIDKLKLNMNAGNIDYGAFYGQICASLNMDSKTNTESVLNAVKTLVKQTGEAKIEAAGNLGVLTISEEKLYLKMLQGGQTEVLKIVEEKRAEFENRQNEALIDLYNRNSDKIISCLTVTGWNEVKKLGFESAKKIVDCFPERIFLSKMIRTGDETHDLDWYRKNDPKALRDNPELYQSLMKAYKSNK